MNMKKAIAEFIGTFALVLVGCGAAVIGGMASGATSVDALGIGAAFGLTIVAMAYGIGQISGCHINPAVSFGVLVAGRMTMQDFITYVIAQVLGAIAGAVVLYIILSGKASGWNGGLGQNGWGPGYLGEYGLGAALIYEAVAAFLRAGRHRGPRHRAHAHRHPSLWHQHHRHLAEPCPLARTGHCRRRDEAGEACASVAVHRGAADRRRCRRLSVQVGHSCCR
jgi:hypothetical protein